MRKFFPAGNVLAAGATLGEEHFSNILELIPPSARAGAIETVVVLDFAGIDDATPSYVKATVLALHQCGRLAAGVLGHDEAIDVGNRVLKLNIIVALLNASADIQLCVNEVFALRGLGILAGALITDDRLEAAVLLGEVDPRAERTLIVTAALPHFTAPELPDWDIKEEGLSVNGWNNRLAELHRQRLIRRRAEGRALRFFPLASKVTTYGQVLSRK